MRLAVLLSLLFVAAAARAEPSPSSDRAKAKALYQTATSHYNLSEYAEALKDFKEAYRLINDPVLLFNIAQCHRQLKQSDEAAQFYRAYRREYPDAGNRLEVDRLISQMDEAIAQQRAQQPPTGTLPGPSPAPAHVEPTVTATPPAAQSPTLTATPDQPHAKKRTWIWGVVAGVAVVVVVGVTIGVVLGTEKSTLPPKLMDVRF